MTNVPGSISQSIFLRKHYGMKGREHFARHRGKSLESPSVFSFVNLTWEYGYAYTCGDCNIIALSRGSPQKWRDGTWVLLRWGSALGVAQRRLNGLCDCKRRDTYRGNAAQTQRSVSIKLTAYHRSNGLEIIPKETNERHITRTRSFIPFLRSSSFRKIHCESQSVSEPNRGKRFSSGGLRKLKKVETGHPRLSGADRRKSMILDFDR